MKVKATIVLITVLSVLLVACNADPDGSVVTTADPGTSVVNTVASTSILIRIKGERSSNHER